MLLLLSIVDNVLVNWPVFCIIWNIWPTGVCLFWSVQVLHKHSQVPLHTRYLILSNIIFKQTFNFRLVNFVVLLLLCFEWTLEWAVTWDRSAIRGGSRLLGLSRSILELEKSYLYENRSKSNQKFNGVLKLGLSGPVLKLRYFKVSKSGLAYFWWSR